jgi:hypothetical protein
MASLFTFCNLSIVLVGTCDLIVRETKVFRTDISITMGLAIFDPDIPNINLLSGGTDEVCLGRRELVEQSFIVTAAGLANAAASYEIVVRCWLPLKSAAKYSVNYYFLEPNLWDIATKI